MAANELDEKYSEPAGPIEYKDAPLHFNFILDEREEPVKIVEPQIDLPFPNGARLIVDEAKRRLCDVVFHFEPDAERPYRLKFFVFNETHHDEGLLLTYGRGGNPASDMLNIYRKKIVERGNVQAHIEMTRGKARLLIQYRKERQIPPDQPE